jgi:hypothetical protein
MDKIRGYLGKPLIVGAAGLLIGLLVGMIFLGWILFPVSWNDTPPSRLQTEYRLDYLKMVVQLYSKDQNKDAALSRWFWVGSDTTLLQELMKASSQPGSGINPAEILSFNNILPNPAAISGQGTGVQTTPGQPQIPNPLQTPTVTTATSGISPILLLVVFCGLTLIIGAALVYILLIRKKGGSSIFGPAKQAIEHTRQVERTDYQAQGQEAPVAQFMTTYMVGDDLYDDSFSIDSPSGEFLGECGVGISETIGVGDPKKVTAFEVWLFDKNDIQTVTKVLMSEHAFNDPNIRQRLLSKGEPTQVDAGKRIILETATLQLEARVVDLSYGQGALPTNSYFDRLTLELAIWPKVAP